MSTQTPNLNLTMPALEELYDLDVWNTNSQKIDDFAGTVQAHLANQQNPHNVTAAQIGVEKPLQDIIDSGAKNRLKITASSTVLSGVTVTINAVKGEITLNGTCETTSTYTITDLSTLGLSTSTTYKICGDLPETSDSRYMLYAYTAGAGQWDNLTNNDKQYDSQWTNLRLRIYAGQTFNNLTLRPMICSVDDFKISPNFVPHCPTLAELYAMVMGVMMS